MDALGINATSEFEKLTIRSSALFGEILLPYGDCSKSKKEPSIIILPNMIRMYNSRSISFPEYVLY